jgi:acetyl esterase/lipase
MLLPIELHRFAERYLGGQDRKMPLASPLYADLTGLPPLLIHVGTEEILLDDSTRFAERARAAGVNVTLNVAQDMIHVWHFFAAVAPEGRDALAEIGAFIRSRFL